jgi:hypothetical protein
MLTLLSAWAFLKATAVDIVTAFCCGSEVMVVCAVYVPVCAGSMAVAHERLLQGGTREFKGSVLTQAQRALVQGLRLSVMTAQRQHFTPTFSRWLVVMKKEG